MHRKKLFKLALIRQGFRAKKNRAHLLKGRDLLLSLAQEETDEEVLSDIERTLQELEEMLGEVEETPTTFRSAPAVERAPDFEITNFSIHPLFLADVQELYNDLGGPGKDLTSFVEDAVAQGWPEHEARVIFYLANYSPFSLSSLLHALLPGDSTDPAWQRQAIPLAEQLARSITDLGRDMLQRGWVGVSEEAEELPSNVEVLEVTD